jgi:N-acetyl-gamma-glutamyl-phosphate reductase
VPKLPFHSERAERDHDIKIPVFANETRRQALLIAEFDNLGKGASGAAVQNLMLALGR